MHYIWDKLGLGEFSYQGIFKILILSLISLPSSDQVLACFYLQFLYLFIKFLLLKIDYQIWTWHMSVPSHIWRGVVWNSHPQMWQHTATDNSLNLLQVQSVMYAQLRCVAEELPAIYIGIYLWHKSLTLSSLFLKLLLFLQKGLL